MKDEPVLIHGENHRDERGTLSSYNEFDLTPIKRLYLVEHPITEVIRAWQLHKAEQKWFHVIYGSFKIVIVRPDDWNDLAGKVVIKEFILKAGDNKILHVPGNFGNGFKALEPFSKMMVFSNFTLQESSNDNLRYGNDMWYNWSD